MLMRAKGESGELYPELSTVAAAGGSGRVARRGERKREGNGRWRRCSATRGRQREAGGARLALHGGRRHCTTAAGGAEKQSRQVG